MHENVWLFICMINKAFIGFGDLVRKLQR